MEKENFETKIQRIAREFDRRPPQQTWKNIEQGIGSTGNSFRPRNLPKWALPAGLAAAILITGLLIWPQFKSEPVWMDNFWDALLLAEQENKPLLLLFTRTSPDCKRLDNILAHSDIDDLNDHYIPVRLLLDDQTPMDGAPPVIQLFSDKNIELVHLPEYGQSALRAVDQDIILKTWGQVWEFWLEDDFHSSRPPVLVLLTPDKKRIAQYDYVVNTEFSAREMSRDIERWLALNLDVYAAPHFEGKKLFTDLCASCHNRNMKDPLTGPALGGIREKWSAYPEEDLYNFIRNSRQMIAEGHPLALASWNEEGHSIMTSFPELTKGELKILVDYIEWQYARN